MRCSERGGSGRGGVGGLGVRGLVLCLGLVGASVLGGCHRFSVERDGLWGSSVVLRGTGGGAGGLGGVGLVSAE